MGCWKLYVDAAERLVAADEEESLRERHLIWCVDLAEEAAQHLREPRKPPGW